MKKLFLVLIAFTFVISCSSSDDEDCAPITDFNLAYIDENVGFFYHTRGSNLDFSIIEYGLPGFELGVNPIGVYRNYADPFYGSMDGTNFYILRNFEPNTTYEAYIKLECSLDNYSVYSEPIVFTTLALGEGCSKPDSLIEIEKTNKTILLDWEGYNNNAWLVEVFNLDTIEESEIYFDYTVYEKPYLIESLLPNTNYEIRVSSICDGALKIGAPSNYITVLTLSL
ncbi:MAG: hypothetical protein KUG68_06800, partial [Flavobacteriaceae bacterium]|nr:hypothetical protein [Flavobacteriaceae bacterium]